MSQTRLAQPWLRFSASTENKMLSGPGRWGALEHETALHHPFQRIVEVGCSGPIPSRWLNLCFHRCSGRQTLLHDVLAIWKPCLAITPIHRRMNPCVSWS